MEFFRSNLWEIRRSVELRRFGLILSLVHIYNFILWNQQESLPLKYARSGDPLCHPIFSSCHWLQWIPESVLSFGFHSYLLLAIVTAFLFLSSRLVFLAWMTSLLLWGDLILLYIQDYRLASNDIYLLLLFSTILLFIPNKIRLLKGLTLTFYLATAISLLSPEWLMGEWFVQKTGFHPKLSEWLAGLIVLIQLIAPLGLLLKNRRNFWLSFSALLVVHLGLIYLGDSFHQVVMLAGLSLFLFCRLQSENDYQRFTYQNFSRPEPSNLWLYLFLLLFWSTEALTWLPNIDNKISDTALSFSITQRGAQFECRQKVFAKFNKKIIELKDKESAECQPYFELVEIKNLCAKYQNMPGFIDLEVYFEVRDLKSIRFERIIENQKFCQPPIQLPQVGSFDGF